MRSLLICLIGVTLLAFPAQAQDKAEISAWFHSLKLPNTIGSMPAGASCCHEADCRQREIRTVGFIREAWIDEIQAWAVIPLESRITDQDVLDKRPFMQSVICYVPGSGVVCDVPGRTGG